MVGDVPADRAAYRFPAASPPDAAVPSKAPNSVTVPRVVDRRGTMRLMLC